MSALSTPGANFHVYFANFKSDIYLSIYYAAPVSSEELTELYPSNRNFQSWISGTLA